MLGGVRLKVVFAHEKTCFAYISPKYSTNNERTQCVQVLCRDKTLYLWVVFSPHVAEGQIACNPVYSRLLALEQGSDVFVSPYNDIKVLDCLYIDTDSPDDQEILEHNAELLQLHILDQLRLVVAYQKAMVWISPSMPIMFTPKQTGILVNHSQILVKIDAFNQGLPNTTDVLPKEIEAKFKTIASVNENMLRPYINPPKKLILRVLPIDSDGKKNLIHPYTVFMHEDLIEERYKDSTVILATMNNFLSLRDDKDEDMTIENEDVIEDLCVEVVPVNNVVFRSLCREVYNKSIPTVLIPKSLKAIVNLEKGEKLLITFIGDKVEQPEHISITTFSDEELPNVDVIERFKKCVISNTHSGKKFLINSRLLKQNSEITTGYLQFILTPGKLRYTLLNSESFRNCSVSASCIFNGNMVYTKPQYPILEYDSKSYCRTMKSVETLVDKVISHLYFEIHREASFKGVSEIKSNVLVTGLSGTGKTSLCHTVQKELTVWSHIVHCRSLRSRKDIPDILGKLILKCEEHSPAVLICDDVDSLVPPNIDGLSHSDIAYYERLAAIIKNILQSSANVCVLMTSISIKALHPTLRQFNGKPLFTAQFNIPELGQEERVELFKHLLNDKIREQFEVDDDDVIKLSMDTAGNSVREITDYFNKKIFNTAKKKKSHAEDYRPRLVEDVTKDEEKASAFDIWGPVGGLEDVKRILTERIFWPLMYPALFPSQASGILLYGPPGTGKSHIGSCLARARDMRVITVKGPELLSKYIGQSEAAVRDVFDKADAQRPCILFFDEFDSLAPKRGHDSTGVTDRVVTQLLARLDGAEGGARGPVLCATSRPDLLDPALLRAGRLQTHLCTDLPATHERYEVLRTFTKSVAVSEDVDLPRLAEVTEGYSPADLKSLLITAQLGRLEKQLENKQVKEMESVVVYQEDVDSALLETKPSLSPEQRMFYDTIYKRFRGETLSTEQRQIAREQQRERVTLA